MPLVSVVVALHNGEAFLAETLNSALNQTHAEVEVIVVDDGSTDGSAEVLERFAGRVVAFRQPNRGASAARNRGLAEARGTYVIFLDHDDVWEPTFVELLAARLASVDDSVVGAVAGWEEIDADGGRRPETRFAVEASYGLRDLTRRCWSGPSGVMLRRDAMLAVGGWDERLYLAQDWDLWLRLAAAGGTFVGVDGVLWFYRRHDRSLSRQLDLMLVDARSLCDRHLVNPALPADVRRDLRRGLGVFLFSLAVCLYERGNDDTGRHTLADAVRIHPALLHEAPTYWALLCAVRSPSAEGVGYKVDLDRAEARVLAAMETVLGASPDERLARDAYGLAFAALAQLAHRQRQMPAVRRYVARAVRADPRLWFDRALLGFWVKSLAGARAVTTASRWKRALRNEP